MITAETTREELDIIYLNEIINDPQLRKKQKEFLQFYFFKYPKIYERTKRGLLKAATMYFGWDILKTHDLIMETIEQDKYQKLLDDAQKRLEDQHEESIKNSPSLAEEGPK